MRLTVRPKKFTPSDSLRECVDLRLRFALSRFQDSIREVVVVLDDVNGPKGGVDKRCQVVVRLTPRGRVAIEQNDVDFEIAVAAAAERAGRTVGRELERRRDGRTESPGMSPRE